MGLPLMGASCCFYPWLPVFVTTCTAKRTSGKCKDAIEMECTGDFGAEGEPGSNFQYKAKGTSNPSPQEIEDLINYTDKIAEVHNTL